MKTLLAVLLALTVPLQTPANPTVVREDPPHWAMDAVWYQIFPERFRNGDPSNDPSPEDLVGSWPHDPNVNWNVSPWTSDWYALQPWEAENGKGFYYNAQRRRYGGDLQGVIDKLDYLKALGVTAIYLNPIFESPSLHKYDATSYHHVDNNFGPDPVGDRKIWSEEDPADPSTWKWTSADRLFLELIRQCHERGMKIIIDGVFNHVGITFWAFRDVVEKGENSKYKDWFTITRFDDPSTPENEFAYQGWAGVAELPEIREVGDALAPGPTEHIRHIVSRWGDPDGDGDPSDGIDGWRLDVAEMVGHGFWRQFRRWVLDVNPNAYLAGEVWWEDYRANKMFNAAPWLEGDQFDSVMNYRFADAVKSFFVDQKRAISATELDRRLAQVRRDYRPETAFALMSLMDSHDTDRLASIIVNPDRDYDHLINPRDDPSYQVRAPNQRERQIQRLVATFQFTYLGAPMVYYGDEAGMWGADDPDERKPMVWDDLRYDDEASHPFGRPRPRDEVAFNADLYGHYAALGRLRANTPALRRGSYETVVADDSRRLFGFRRAFGASWVLAYFNDSPREQSVELPAEYERVRNLLTGRVLARGGPTMTVRVPALDAVLLGPAP